jgi:hypothetical protein
VDEFLARCGCFGTFSTCDLQAFRATLEGVHTNGHDGAGGVDELSERIAALAAQRQELREANASGEVLEENRRQLSESQWALSQALIERHLPGFASS